MAVNTPAVVRDRPDGINIVGDIPANTAGISLEGEYGVGATRQTKITLTDLSVTMTDGGASGSIGTQKIYDFPAGNIIVLGAVSNLTSIARVGSAITATAAVKHSLGSAAEATNDTLDSTQANMIPSTSATLAAGVGSGGGESTAVAVVDGTAAAADAILNFGIADAGSSGNDALTVSGTVTITWINLGDN